MTYRARPAEPSDRERLAELWERSVRATHRFLSEADVVRLRPLVVAELADASYQWWVLEQAGSLAGFLAFAHDCIEGLFIDPAFLRRGGGQYLVEHAQSLCCGSVLSVTVNEQNEEALRFYLSQGFEIAERCAVDERADPFPILRLERATPSGGTAGCRAPCASP